MGSGSFTSDTFSLILVIPLYRPPVTYFPLSDPEKSYGAAFPFYPCTLLAPSAQKERSSTWRYWLACRPLAMDKLASPPNGFQCRKIIVKFLLSLINPPRIWPPRFLISLLLKLRILNWLWPDSSPFLRWWQTYSHPRSPILQPSIFKWTNWL